MSELLHEVKETIKGKKRLQAVFGETEGAELTELAIKLSAERWSSAPDFIEWMIDDAVRGDSFEAVRRKWSMKLKAVNR